MSARLARLWKVVAVALAASAAGPLPAGGAEPGFAARPTAKRQGDAVAISFEVKAPCGAAVAVIGRDGRVVRHLAAGLLGANAPAPFRKGSLRQTLTWDGKDDDGKPLGPDFSGYSVRVGLGLAARFERVIGWSGQRIDAPRAMACGPDGTLYVVHGEAFYGHRRTTLITAFDRDGRYLRQVYPGPGDLPPQKRPGWPWIKLPDGAEVPVIHHVLSRSVYPGAYFGTHEHGHPAVTSDGRLVIVCGVRHTIRSTIKFTDVRGGRRLLVLGTDGSVPGNFLGPVLAGEAVGGTGFVAVSPDGRTAYVAGLGGNIWARRTPDTIHHAVYRAGLDGSGKAEVFLGRPGKPGSGRTGLNDPGALATDAKGNLYVSDRGNKRIAAFKPDGSFLGEIPTEPAEEIAVSRKTGAVYARIGDRLVKFGGLTDPTRQAERPFPKVGRERGRTYCMALDDSGERAALYLSACQWVLHKLEKVVDRGRTFESLGDPIAARAHKADPGLRFVMNVMVAGRKLITATPSFPRASADSAAYDALTGKYLGPFRPKDASGKGEKRNALMFCGGEMTAGKDGRLYVQTGGFMWPEKGTANPGSIRRYDGEGKALPFPAVGKHYIARWYHGHHRPGGMFATRGGQLYVAAFPGYRGRDQKQRGMHVLHIGPDGAVKNDSLVGVAGATVGGLAVDPSGSVYVGVQVWPKGGRVPPWFAGRLPKDSRYGHPGTAYRQHGSIVKFPPAGGRIEPDPSGRYVGHAGGYAGRKEWARGVVVALKGAEWIRRAGYIAINSPNEVGCQCENTRFDVDDYGRLFVPEPFRFRVTVLDSAGNELAHFGGYGNMDNRGPKSQRPEPAIPFGWPIGVEVSGERIFVADLNNRRIVAATVAPAAAETCAIK